MHRLNFILGRRATFSNRTCRRRYVCVCVCAPSIGETRLNAYAQKQQRSKEEKRCVHAHISFAEGRPHLQISTAQTSGVMIMSKHTFLSVICVCVRVCRVVELVRDRNRLTLRSIRICKIGRKKMNAHGISRGETEFTAMPLSCRCYACSIEKEKPFVVETQTR